MTNIRPPTAQSRNDLVLPLEQFGPSPSATRRQPPPPRRSKRPCDAHRLTPDIAPAPVPRVYVIAINRRAATADMPAPLCVHVVTSSYIDDATWVASVEEPRRSRHVPRHVHRACAALLRADQLVASGTVQDALVRASCTVEKVGEGAKLGAIARQSWR